MSDDGGGGDDNDGRLHKARNQIRIFSLETCLTLSLIFGSSKALSKDLKRALTVQRISMKVCMSDMTVMVVMIDNDAADSDVDENYKSKLVISAVWT